MANATPLTKKQWLELLRNLWQESLQNYEPVAYYKEWEDKSGKHKDIKFEQTEGYSPLFTPPKTMARTE